MSNQEFVEKTITSTKEIVIVEKITGELREINDTGIVVKFIKRNYLITEIIAWENIIDAYYTEKSPRRIIINCLTTRIEEVKGKCIEQDAHKIIIQKEYRGQKRRIIIPFNRFYKRIMTKKMINIEPDIETENYNESRKW